jgi:ABC-type transport system substrate-binding protein
MGIRLPTCDAQTFHRRVQECLPKDLLTALGPLIDSIGKLSEEITVVDRAVQDLISVRYPKAKVLQQVAGVGPLISLTFVLTIGDPARFKKSREVGPYLGLVPRQRQSGDYFPELRISKTGDNYLRSLLVSGAHYILGHRGPDTDLRRWGLQRAQGGKSAKKRADQTQGGGATGESTLVTKPVDTTKEAKRGGVFHDRVNREPGHFDGQAQGQVQLNFFNSLAYEALVRNKAGHLERSTFSDVEPQLAQSWEFNGDGTQLTFKLRQGVKWQNRPPVNGRAFEAEDVVQSWNRYIGLVSNDRASMANSLNPAAPIVSVTAPDSRTVVVKLSEPTSYLLQRYASMVTGELGSIYPSEADGGFDPKQDQIGTGGYMLDKFEPSIRLEYTRNPDYWDENAAYPDRIQIPVVPEYATGLAQFRAGAIYAYQVLAEDQITTKKDLPQINLYPLAPRATNPLFQMRFGWQPIEGNKSPFLDIRVRQALALSLERDNYIDAFFNVSRFEAEGIPVETYYDTSMSHNSWTLDPRDEKTFGEDAKYYTHDPAEAKKLFDAAQSAYGSNFPAIPSAHVDIFGGAYSQGTEAMDNFARSLGFTIDAKTIVYNKDYLPLYVTRRGQFEGILYGIGATPSPDVTDFYVWKYYSKSGETSGALGNGGPDGSLGDGSGDPTADSMIENARHELDSKKRQQIIADLQRYLAKQQYAVSPPGVADGFVMAWPAVSNYNVWQDDSRTVSFAIPSLMSYWLDNTKAPLA